MTESISDRIRAKLEQGLKPSVLEIVDESERHRGHGGYREGGETHFRISVTAEAFKGLSRIDRERRVHALLADEIAERIHALTLSLRDQ